jgi:hypothetical protein
MKNKTRWIVWVLTIVVILTCVVLFHGIPIPIWDDSPESLFIYTAPGAAYTDYSYIPDIQIWGTGEIVWVEYSESGQRSVFAGKLSQEELRAAVDKIIDSGILSSNDSSKDYCPYPGIDNELHIELAFDGTVQTLRVADPSICELSLFLSDGAGAKGTLYRPQKGTLYAFPLEETSIPVDTEASFVWPEEYPFTLQEVSKQGFIEIQGNVLEYAWNVVNSSWDPVIMSKQEKFLMAVGIPDIKP